MQKDSEIFSDSGHTMPCQAASGESPVKAFQCSHCPLIFKSKVYLFEHLNKVHGFDVDRALKDAGLKLSGVKEANQDNKSSGSSNGFVCKHCDLIARQWHVLKEHEKRCARNTEKKKGSGSAYISETSGTKATVTSTNQHKEGAGVKDISPSFSVTSTSTPKFSVDSSKDLKTYKRPLQTITKYFTTSSETNGTPQGMLSESPILSDQSTKGTLILQESPSNNSGVFKVTAKSTIDISSNISDRLLLDDHLINDRFQKPKEGLRDSLSNTHKRTNIESTEGPPAKKAKSCTRDTNPLINGETSKQQSSIPNFLFEFSEDEESFHLGNRDTGSSNVYFCKHCDYSDASITHVSNHYKTDHPYIRFNFVYIQDPSDQSATFRCLECPIEFSSAPELKRHYKENHPNAADVFVVQACELSLAFRCFTCQFTTDVLKSLKEHYKETHPSHQMDNSLLYCRYSVVRGQAVSSPLNSWETTPERNSPKSAHTSNKELKNEPSPQHSTPRAADMALYHCDNCNFSHKSVVVMHVHYQRSHPDEPVTIDKIKHLRSASYTTPEKSSNPKTVMENCTPQKNASESFEKDKAELSQQNVTLSLISPVHTPEASKTNLKSPKLQKVKSTEDSNKTRKPLSKYKEDIPTKMDSSQERMFYCQFCSYSSTKIRSVIGHHNAKHAMNGPISVEELLCYSAKMQKKKLQSDAKASEDSQTSKPVAVQSKKALEFDEIDAGVASTSRFKAYECAEKLFYCQKCNFASPTVKGVLNHQSKIHKRINSSKDCILRHTALICKEIEKSKSQTTDLSFATNLPLPILNIGDENVFFCHFCNYRHSTMDRLMKHYFKNHRGFKITSEQIYLHTSMIFEKTQLMHLKTAKCNLETLEKKEVEKKKSTKLAECVSDSLSSSAGVSQTQRDLKCHRCSFITQYLYVLRRHMWKVHRANRTSSDILRFCFKQGNIPSGYYCDLCVFSDNKAEPVYKHYLEQHPERKLSFQYVSTRLYVGPDSCAPKRKKCDLKQTSVRNESKKYSCKSCSFKASSMLDFTRHYRAVHPWSVKEDGSVPGVKISKKRCTNSQLKDDDEILKSFETYQIPLEFDKSLDSFDEEEESDNAFKCSFCPAIFYSQHSLSTHCGMKHQSALHEKSEQQGTQIHVQVFTCTHCNYINSNYQGVLTHCQIKHPYLESGADGLHLDKVSLKSLNAGLNKSSPGKSLKYRGYICKTCHHICATVEKLNKHSEKYHKKPVSNIFAKSAAKTPAVSKIKQSNAYSTQKLASKASFIRKKIRAVIHCKHCRYFCTTNIALSRHMRIQHGEPSVGELKDNAYRCSLCSQLYFRKKRLGTHYMKKHGKDAYIKYFVSVHKQLPESASANQPSTKPLQSPSAALKSSKTAEEKILFYKCPGCSYVNASYHGTLTHCQMVHPDLVVRADKLETAEVCVDNMAKCTMGKTSNEKGYMCNKCPQIHASLVNLKIHSEKFHDHAKPSASEHLDDTAAEQQPHQSFSLLKEDSAKNKKLTANTTEIHPSQKLGTPETSQSNAQSLQTKDAVFKCHMCNYKGSCRKYLYCHYKYTHKLDALSMFKLLEKYSCRSNKLRTAQSEESAHNKCKKCLNLTFKSSQLLIAHYSTFHYTLDFTVLSQRSNRSTGSYKCSHCMKVIYGIKNLWRHLDRHRTRRMKKAKTAETQTLSITKTTPEAKPNEKNEQPLLETMEELAQGMVSPAENFTLPTSPLQLILKSTDLDPPELESRDHKHSCNQCRRMFMSLKGLRSHERSHAALAAIKKLDKVPPIALKEIIDKYLVYKPGTLRPFMCSFCAYRTPVLSLLKSHLIRKHNDVLMEVVEADNLDELSTQICGKDPPYLTGEKSYSPEANEEPERTEKSLYLEPPAVQRQLNQYSLMAQISVSSQTKLHEPKLSEKGPLQCEFCNFNSRHLARIRRHYLNRHGKRFLKCKNCDFFSGIRKTLEQHMKTGHSTSQSVHTQQKDLCCPFCLYQTKNKNNMIDHIVLHREERVVPIEVRRSKLSHYLQGTVFRCHKCTFTSGSAENLHLHMMKHNDVKPYKCRLCYFDCTQLSNLEAHLSDKHQVVRNHELVGQVSLDQLEATVCKMPEVQDESMSKLEKNNTFEKEMFDTALDETLVNKFTEHDIREKTAMPMMENEHCPTVRGQRIKNDRHARNAAVQSDDPRGPQKDSQGQSSQTCSVDRNLKLTPIKREATKHGEEATKAQASNIKAFVEGGVLHQIPVLNEDGYKKGHQSGTVKMEQNTEAEVADSHHGNKLLYDIKKQANTIRAQDSLKVEMQSQTSMPSCAHLSHRGKFGVSIANCKEEALSLKTSESVTDTYREMPVLEKAFLKEEVSSLRLCKEEDETCDQFKQNRGQKMIAKDENRCKGQEQQEGNLMKEADIQHVHRENATVGAAEFFCSSVVKKKLYTCEFCGRKLTNSHELKRHVMRHGI